MPATFGLGDQKCLRAVRPGQMSLRSGKLLIERARRLAAGSKDRTFAWAVRLYVQEQERKNRFLTGLASAGEKSTAGDWRGTVIDAMPADVVLLLLGCRARVAARFFGALAARTECPQFRTLYEQLEKEELGQLAFAAFARPRLAEVRPLPEMLVQFTAHAVTLGIATRLWLRQRTRLRESGQTFAGFVAALLQPAALG